MKNHIVVKKKTNNGKLTFEDVFYDFCIRHPGEKQKISGWQPYDDELIKVFMKNGRIVTYDYRNKMVTIIKDKAK